MKRTASKPRKSTPTVKLRTNGHKAVDAKSTIAIPSNGALARRITPRQMSFQWLYPSVAAFTPTYVETLLRGALAGNHVQQWELMDLMLDTWPTLASCKQELLYGITRRDLVYDPYSEEDKLATPSAIEREKLVTCAIDSMMPRPEADQNGIEGTVADIMDSWFRGISVSEILWNTVDTDTHGTIWAPQATIWTHPQWYGFDSQGELGLSINDYYPGSAITQQNPRPPVLAPFPPNKFLISIHKVKSGNPLGGPMLRALAWWWCASNFSSDWLLNLAQIFGLPFRWASYAASSPDQTVAAICDMLANMGSAGWAAFPEGTTMELKEATATITHSPQGDLLDRADHYARMLILGQTMTGATIASGRGGQAFGTVEAQLKQDRLDAASEFVENIINRQLIPSILMLNYGDIKEAPTCRFLQETTGTFQDAQRDQILANLGLDIPFSHLRQKYAIPEATGGEEVTKPPPVPVAKPFGGNGAPVGPKGTSPIEKKLPSETPRQVQARQRLEEISLIADTEIFASELRKLATDLVLTKEIPE